MGKIGEQRVAPAVLIYACANMAVEVAIGAFADAERPVDIEGELVGDHGAGDMAAMGRWRHLFALVLASACVPALPQREDRQPDRGPSAPRDPALLRAAMLAGHARERAAVGLPPLAWNRTLAREALDYARAMAVTKRFAPSEQPAARARQGENLWTGPRGDYTFAEMVDFWAAEKRAFIDAAIPGTSRTGNWADVGHYSQIVWRGTAQVGCALASNRTDDYLVCRYFPAGNVLGETVF
jgi:Cysteine-rich secretory protein family